MTLFNPFPVNFYRLSTDFVNDTDAVVLDTRYVSLTVGEIDVIPHIHEPVYFATIMFE
ncbi:hypothetical protein GCM10007084_18120 [Parabacteroides faecis]|nr:hypothetical protein GCM10007084_18120 [Parabacteroides faecis]